MFNFLSQEISLSSLSMNESINNEESLTDLGSFKALGLPRDSGLTKDGDIPKDIGLHKYPALPRDLELPKDLGMCKDLGLHKDLGFPGDLRFFHVNKNEEQIEEFENFEKYNHMYLFSPEHVHEFDEDLEIELPCKKQKIHNDMDEEFLNSNKYPTIGKLFANG